MPVPAVLDRARARRWLHLVAINLRFLIGFAFVPAGLKKVIGEPFTAAGNRGPFHDFLHAFYATGFFYHFVGAVQLTIAVLLLTQRFAWIGALLALPVTTTIMVFCWSTAVYPTATVVTLMFLGTVALVLWDLPRWRGVAEPVDLRPWIACGVAILLVYLALCAATGEVYRPTPGARGEPGYWVLHAIALLPLVTLLIDRRLARRDRGTPDRVARP